MSAELIGGETELSPRFSDSPTYSIAGRAGANASRAFSAADSAASLAAANAADAVAEKWLWEQAYTSDEEMLARADLDAVIANSPIPYHYEQIKRARGDDHAFARERSS